MPDANHETVDLLPNSDLPRSRDSDTRVPISIGHVLRERYVIQERLGSGGKGVVFKALDRYRSSLPEAQQYVALKVLHPGSGLSEQMIGNFWREAHCGQLLSHRNIVNVFELDRDGDVVFFTMEFLDGELLGDLIERMRPAAMQRFQAWQIIRQLGAGLEHAHERGIVHGDLKPRNLLVTREGEVRILDFGAAQPIVRTQLNSDQPDCGPVSLTPAYASCELLEGRAADRRDDVYSLACICYELLTGAHPFARRPATSARDFGVKATRPAGITGRQWRTLQAGLSWHRGGRSMSVHTWIQKLTRGVAEERVTTPLQELKAASAAKPEWQPRAIAASLAVLLITGACIAQLRETSARKTHDAEATRAAPESVTAQVPEPALPSEGASPAEAVVTDARAGDAKDGASTAGSQAVPSVRPFPLTVSVDGYQVISGHRFVEIRVHRNQLQAGSSFAWWTEPATAKEGVDYVHQGKAIQTFPTERQSTRLYVKLLPESERSQRDYFYVAIAQPGRGRSTDKVTRAQIWLPTSRAQLQARR